MNVMVTGFSQPIRGGWADGNNGSSASEILDASKRIAKVRILGHNKGKLTILTRSVVNQVGNQKGIDTLFLEIASWRRNGVA